ncbi:hypothetical protein DPMN_099927 [Dreissena polymorpha]|uniref:Uncharacterized protein n=1 Tax=Dreissena polymorpha TaxID=45954 RepID=A0A9D4LI74_DREPO|nr:hypothetical protein DPMN_099927 [Dreissena polymorpha]
MQNEELLHICEKQLFQLEHKGELYIFLDHHQGLKSNTAVMLQTMQLLVQISPLLHHRTKHLQLVLIDFNSLKNMCKELSLFDI